MYFKFNVNLTDKDYLDYNTFWLLKSPYGKKQIISYRIIIAVLFGIVCLASLFGGGFSADAFVRIIPYVIILILIQIFLNTFFSWTLKGQLNSLKKKGKMGFSPVCEMEFYEEGFIEITPDNTTRQKYSAVERVSIITDKIIYIHVNNVMSYLLPLSCFNSKQQYDDFLAFLKTKCGNIDIYS